jgi:hypothetical protein
MQLGEAREYSIDGEMFSVKLLRKTATDQNSLLVLELLGGEQETVKDPAGIQLGLGPINRRTNTSEFPARK